MGVINYFGLSLFQMSTSIKTSPLTCFHTTTYLNKNINRSQRLCIWLVQVTVLLSLVCNGAIFFEEEVRSSLKRSVVVGIQRAYLIGLEENSFDSGLHGSCKHFTGSCVEELAS